MKRAIGVLISKIGDVKKAIGVLIRKSGNVKKAIGVLEMVVVVFARATPAA